MSSFNARKKAENVIFWWIKVDTMKQIYLTIVLIAGWQLASAQQEQMYTQFMYNKLAWNPGYAGSFESPTLTAVYRNQFIGLEGAPKTAALSFNMPYRADFNVAFGVNVIQHSIGITRILNLDLIPFCYLITMDYGTLSVGVQVGIRQFSQNWGDKRIEVIQPNGDNAIPIGDNNKILVNPGAGVFYKSSNWYAGLAVPRILPDNLDFSAGAEISREVFHANLMGGYTFTPNDNLSITPQTLIKYAVGAPPEADINMTMLLKNKFSGGLTYRTGGGETSAAGESLDILLGLQATEKFFFCLSYDLGLTPLQHYHHGSVELTARYWFNPPAASGSEVSPY